MVWILRRRLSQSGLKEGSKRALEHAKIPEEVIPLPQALGTDQTGLGEDRGPEGEPGQKLRLAITSMGGYWRVDVFGDDTYKTWDCKTTGELGRALADGYMLIKILEP